MALEGGRNVDVRRGAEDDDRILGGAGDDDLRGDAADVLWGTLLSATTISMAPPGMTREGPIGTNLCKDLAQSP